MEYLGRVYQSIVRTKDKPIKKDVKTGETTEHSQSVTHIDFFVKVNPTDHLCNKHAKLTFNRNDILAFADQIKEIESKKINKEVEEDLPF